MLHNRVVGTLILKNDWVVQSIGFKKFLPVGRPSVSVEFLNKWGIDEIVILDIDATREGRKPNFDLITEVSKKSFVALTVGGGIENLDDMRKLIHCGADKISINKLSLTNPEMITQSSNVFGNQCIVVSMDVKKNIIGKYEVYSDNGTRPTGLNPVHWAKRVEELGAGEILLTSIDRNGSKEGYDLDLICLITEAVSIPVIVSGGVGHPKHFLEGFEIANASAAAAGNFFHFTEHSPIVAKAFLKEHGVDVRFDTDATYSESDFSSSGRITKRDEEYLNKLMFEIIKEEVI